MELFLGLPPTGEFGFPWASSNLLCPYCQADQIKKDSKHRFTDFRPSFATDIFQGGPQGQVCQPPVVENTYCFQVCPKNPGFPGFQCPILGMIRHVSTMNPTKTKGGIWILTWRIIPFSKWLITMVIVSPLTGVIPLPNDNFMAYKWGLS